MLQKLLADAKADGQQRLAELEAKLADAARTKKDLADQLAETLHKLHEELAKPKVEKRVEKSIQTEEEAPKMLKPILVIVLFIVLHVLVCSLWFLPVSLTIGCQGLEIARESTPNKGLRLLLVKPNGPAATAGLAEGEYLHSLQEGAGDGLALLTSSTIFEKIVKSTFPGDVLQAKVYAALCIVLALPFRVALHDWSFSDAQLHAIFKRWTHTRPVIFVVKTMCPLVQMERSKRQLSLCVSDDWRCRYVYR